MLATGGPTELKNEMNITDDTFDEYYTLSRLIPFNKCCEIIKKKKDIKSCLDIATSSGHFVYIANKNNIDAEGFDIEYNDTLNEPFLKEFKKKCLFKFDLNNIYKLNKHYDVITNFHLTHVFSKDAFIYLLQCLSSFCNYAYLHISDSNLQYIKTINLIQILDVITLNINMHGVNRETWVFLKFNKKTVIDKIYKFKRPEYIIDLES